METLLIGIGIFGLGMFASWSITSCYYKSIVKKSVQSIASICDDDEVVIPQSINMTVSVFKYDKDTITIYDVFGYVDTYECWFLIHDTSKKITRWHKKRDVKEMVIITK